MEVGQLWVILDWQTKVYNGQLDVWGKIKG
jgi:hypothetical protein